MTPEQELISALQTIPWFQELNPEYFVKLANISSIIEVDAVEDLFHQGDKQDFLYIILKGRVAVEIAVPGKGRTRIYTAEPTEMLGWSSVTRVVHQRTASAVTVLPSILIQISALEMKNLCEQNHSFGYLIMQRIANVAASRLLITRLQLLDIFSHSSKEGSNA